MDTVGRETTFVGKKEVDDLSSTSFSKEEDAEVSTMRGGLLPTLKLVLTIAPLWSGKDSQYPLSKMKLKLVSPGGDEVRIESSYMLQDKKNTRYGKLLR